MTTTQLLIYYGLLIAAAAQLGVACLNLRLVEVLGWRQALESVPLLMKEVFQVHAWFISVTLAIFGVVTLRFADVMVRGDEAIATWLVVGIGLFWATRTVLQVTYYSRSHWWGRPSRTAIHIILLCLYGAMAVVYLSAGWLGR